MLIILIVYFVCFALWIFGSIFAFHVTKRYYEPKSRMRLAVQVYLYVSLAIILFSFYMIYKVNWAGVA